MSSQEIIGRADTADLDMVLGTVKEAARTPLPPNLSLTSTASASASVKTQYLGEKSDLRDETHHVDVVVDSMREGAEDMSELPHYRSSMSALSSKSSKEVEPTVVNEAPMLSCSLSKISRKSSVEASAAEAVPKLSTSNSLSLASKASNASLRKESGSQAVDQVHHADDASAASGGGASANTQCTDSKFRNSTLNLRPETNEYLQNKLEKLEETLLRSSEEIKDETYYKEGKKHVRFNQAERDKLTLLWRWMEKNRGDGREVKFNWGDFNKESFNAFVFKVDGIILDEVLEELKLSEEVKITLRGNGVYSSTSLVEKSKYWYEKEIKLSSTGIHQIEKFKKWYKYQLDTYLPSDWIVSFRKEAGQVEEFEWRKVLKAIGLKADAIQALEINDVCDFATLNHMSKKWKISEPTLRGDENHFDWKDWQKMGLKESDARQIINFRHWHKFYVARKTYKSNWAADFNSAQYKRFVQRYIDPTKLDEFKKPGWRASWNDRLKLAQEKQDYYDILQAAAEDGHLTKQDRNRLRQHYQDRREKMELIQEINEGVGDRSFQEKRLGEIFEEDAAIDIERKKQEVLLFQKCSRFLISSSLSVALLWCWGITTAYFMFAPIIQLSFDGGNTKEQVNWEENKFAHFIYNITFGLVTAVVVQEVSEENAEKHLYNRFQPIYKEYLTGLERKIRSEKNRSEARGKLRQAWFTLRKFPMKAVLFSAHYYTYYWIITGFVTLVYAISLDLFGKDLQASNPLYSSGQTWAGVATTIAYTHFGLSGKNAPKNDDAKDAIDRTGGGDGANGREEANFTDESGETNVVKAASVEELELQVKEAEEEMRAAADRQDYVTAVKLQKDIMELNKKIEDEKEAVATGDATDITII